MEEDEVSWQGPDHTEPWSLIFILDSVEGHLEDYKQQSDMIWHDFCKLTLAAMLHTVGGKNGSKKT